LDLEGLETLVATVFWIPGEALLALPLLGTFAAAVFDFAPAFAVFFTAAAVVFGDLEAFLEGVAAFLTAPPLGF